MQKKGGERGGRGKKVKENNWLMRQYSTAVGHTKDDRTLRLQNGHYPEEKYN